MALQRGTKGPAVENLQTSLAALGLSPGPIDGVFGRKTEEAVIEFQQRMGLAEDGIVGPNTTAAIAEALKALRQGHRVAELPNGDPQAAKQTLAKAQVFRRGGGSGGFRSIVAAKAQKAGLKPKFKSGFKAGGGLLLVGAIGVGLWFLSQRSGGLGTSFDEFADTDGLR